ncbi:MAG TPA: hypothetical protein VFO38_02240 [Candidatus Saccharimonadales bacterium]|nr:hypothetical protein [Candidatus Saccharimonadales bacterium]
MKYTQKLHSIVRLTGQLIVFGCLCWFGYMLVPDVNNKEASVALNWALLVYLCVVAEYWLYTWYARKHTWAYIKATYKNSSRPAGVPLAGPILETGARSVAISAIYEIPLSSMHSAYLTQIEVTRNIISNYDKSNYMLRYLVIAVDLGVPTPHIFIDGRSQNRFRRKTTDLWSLTKLVHKKNKINDLEGDFYKYFDVYTADRDYLSALTIVTPDVMLVLRNQGYSFDYEIHNGRLYVIHEAKALLSTAEVQAMLKAAQSCLGELIPQITKHKYHDAHRELAYQADRLHRWAAGFSILMVGRFFAKVLFCLVVGVIVGGYIKEFVAWQ